MDIRRERDVSWWNRKTHLENRWLIIFIVSLILILTLLVILLSPKQKDCASNNSNVCVTPGCIQATSLILDHMDTSVAPCDDFYHFVCGGYIKKTIIPDDRTQVTTFTEIHDKVQNQLRTVLEEPINQNETPAFKKVKAFYQTCNDKKTIEKGGLNVLKKLLFKLGGWPVLQGDTWVESQFDWRQTIYNFSRVGLPTGYFVSVSVGPDLKNSSKRTIEVDQPNFGLSREFIVEGLNNSLVQAYYDYMVDIAKLCGADTDVAARELKEVFDFESKLANYALPKEERRNITNLYNPMTIAQLQQLTPSINWLEYINKLLPQRVQVTRDDIILVAVPKYMVDFEHFINRSPKRVQANYLFWRAVNSLIPYLSDDVRQRELAYQQIISGITQRPPRWRECIGETQGSLPILVGSLFIRKYFHQDAKENALEMVQFLKDGFQKVLKNVDWMDDATKQKAIEKASKISDHIAYPDEMLDDSQLENVYGKLNVKAGEYLQSVLNVNFHSVDFFYGRLKQPVNKSDWIEYGNTAQVNAYYHPLENSIIFPAGILQGVLFNKDRPQYMNFGAIGSVIGHEITHGFDDTGRQFDKDGNLVDWWAPDTKAAFLNKAECIISQYGNYTVAAINDAHLNGINTQGENIADNGGVKEAYLAYLDWAEHNGEETGLPSLPYNSKQLFWISAAMNWCAKLRPESLKLNVELDTHSPEEFRVLGPFTNSPYFSTDFGCASGTRMNPVHKCSIW